MLPWRSLTLLIAKLISPSKRAWISSLWMAPLCFGAESLFPKQQSWCIFGSRRLPTKQQRKSWHGSWSWWIKWGNGISFDPPQRKIQFGLTSIMNVLCFLLYFDGCFCCCLASKLTVMCSSSSACCLECPRLWRITNLSLVVNKQDQRTMKTAIYFWSFRCLRTF